MKTPDQTAKVYRRAEELAQSGRFTSWMHIELALQEEGHTEAPNHLRSRAKRHWLDTLCAKSRKPSSFDA